MQHVVDIIAAFLCLTDFPVNLCEKMEATTYDYDYTDEPYTPVEPCDRDSDNNLGAHLSILFYFMFLFSLCGNGLVLVIIHR